MPDPAGKSKFEVLQMSSTLHSCSYFAALPSVLTKNVEPLVPVDILASVHTYILDGFHCETAQNVAEWFLIWVFSANEHGVMRWGWVANRSNMERKMLRGEFSKVKINIAAQMTECCMDQWYGLNDTRVQYQEIYEDFWADVEGKTSISIVITGANKPPWALNGHSAGSSTDPLTQHLNSAHRRQQESIMGVCACACVCMFVLVHWKANPLHACLGGNSTPTSH